MRTTRIHCIRHAEVAAEWKQQIYGDLDVPLSDDGERASIDAARALDTVHLEAVVSSGLSRAEFLAAELRRPRGLARRDEPRLREISRGAWANRSIAELEASSPGAFAAWLAQPKHARPPGGESLADVQLRAWPVVEGLATEFRGSELAIVAHLWVLRSIACRVLGFDLDDARRIELPYAASFVLDVPYAADQLPVFVGLDMGAAPDRASAWRRGPHQT